MDVWNVTLVFAAGYIAVVSLARLMRQHRDKLVADLRREVEEERQRQRLEANRLEAEERFNERQRRRKAA